MDANANQIAFRTAISATQIPGLSTRVYSVDNAGGIRESLRADVNAWYGGNDPIATGKIGTPLAAVQKDDETRTVLVHYLTPENKLAATCQTTGPWFDWSDLNLQAIPAAPYSQIGACFLPGSILRDRIFVQLTDNTIQEYYWDMGQAGYTGTASGNLGTALPGTAIAATAYVGSNGESIRVYFQDLNRNIVEYIHESGPFTKNATVVANAPPRCPIAIIPCTLPKSHNGPSLRLYYNAAGDAIREMCNDSGTWFQGGFMRACIPGSSVTLVSSNTDPSARIRLYWQQGYLTSAVSEMILSENGGWRVGMMGIPPVIQLVPVADA